MKIQLLPRQFFYFCMNTTQCIFLKSLPKYTREAPHAFDINVKPDMVSQNYKIFIKFPSLLLKITWAPRFAQKNIYIK